MPLFNELGRHTPPPPPYSLNKRDTGKSQSANEVSQRPAPPPPPPYLTSTQKPDCKIPSIDSIWRQALASDDSYSCRNKSALFLSSAPRHRSAVQDPNPQQRLEDYPETWKYSWSRPGEPAHPVEPRWTPGGVLGYPGPPLGGATVLCPRFSVERLAHPIPHRVAFSAGTRARPHHDRLTSQLSRVVPSGNSVTSYATQPPIHTTTAVTRMDQKPPHTFRKQSNKDIASLANIVANTPSYFQPYETMCPLSVLPSQGKVEKLVKLPTSQELDDANEGSSGSGESSDGDGEPTRLAAVPEGQDYASSAQSRCETRPSKECMMSQGRERGHPASQSSRRRHSASARFMPYKRRQTVGEKMDRRFGGAVQVGGGELLEMQSDLGLNGEERETY